MPGKKIVIRQRHYYSAICWHLRTVCGTSMKSPYRDRCSALSRLCQDIRYLPCIGFTSSLIKLRGCQKCGQNHDNYKRLYDCLSPKLNTHIWMMDIIWRQCYILTSYHHDTFPPRGNMAGGNLMVSRSAQHHDDHLTSASGWLHSSSPSRTKSILWRWSAHMDKSTFSSLPTWWTWWMWWTRWTWWRWWTRWT